MNTSTYEPRTAPPAAAPDPFAALTESFRPKRAVSYLRVSTRDQAERGGREEGFSIPAQRDANRKKAQSMGAMIVKEFVERGVSGTSTNRPALQQMLRYLDDEQDTIDYVIVHKLDRLARNRADDVALNQRFQKHGIRLVSTSENIDQTPGGILLHGIMSSIAEFYSRNLANEVLKGMNEKVRNGGTVGRAPIGYLNTRIIQNGVENRIVTVDDQRGPLITWAFHAYATGEHTVVSLAEALNARGLTTVPARKLTERPVLPKHVHNVLTNVFYTGITTFKGVQYPGNHEPLIDKATFEEVQTILKGKLSGERSIKHDHYLKSTLFCGQCESRMSVQKVRNSKGDYYSYYSCLGRHAKRTDCDLRAIPIDRAEDLIQQIYDRLTLTTAYRENLEGFLQEELKVFTAESREEHEQLTASQQQIQRKQQKLLEAHYNDAIPLEMLRKEQTKLDSELVKVAQQLEALNADLDDAQELITLALNLAEHAASTYKNAPEKIRRLLNQTFFERLLVIIDGNGNHQITTDLTPGYGVIFNPSIKAQVATLNATKEATSEAKRSASPTPGLHKSAAVTIHRPKPNAPKTSENQAPANDSHLENQKEAKKPHELAQCLRKSTVVDLAGGLSKLAPALARMVASHRAIRRRACPPGPPRRSLLQLSRPDEAALQEAETAYLSGRSLKAVAKEVGIGHERLSRLLRERGLRLRNQSPTREETAQMKARYNEGMSLERIGAVLGYSPGTVRAHLLAARVVMRDSHGR